MINNFAKGKYIFLILVSFGIFCLNIASAQEESDQKILGFSLSNYNEKNKKTWDLVGDTLEVYGNLIKLTNIKADLYGEEEDMVLTADSGIFDRTEGKLHLQDNVVIITESGAEMMTDTLDWLQNTQTVTTQDKVNIYKENMEAEGVGAVGQPNLKQVSLNKDVQVDINSESEGKMKKTTITCDGPLDIDYQKQEAVFNKNVKAYDGESELYADKMTAYFDKQTKKIVKIICEGNVKIMRGQDISYSDKAIYDTETQKISLIGRPKLIIYSKEGMGDIE
ncbi:MAG: LPS export ABC transporter periplasmic protein LptC [Candidatus Omnitrophica bacterium]|nr:LPS export ABC transporter periplasmic protein LptC [Candidatus Omnitrophota bacterium]